jgi:hypothetical protein
LQQSAAPCRGWTPLLGKMPEIFRFPAPDPSSLNFTLETCNLQIFQRLTASFE